VVEKSPSKTMGLQAPESTQPQADFSSIGDKVRGRHIMSASRATCTHFLLALFFSDCSCQPHFGAI
jgi:hypothetical protein